MKWDARTEVVRLAIAIDRGDIEMVEGCRLLVKHFGDAGLRDDPDALMIVGVESETDDLPVGPEKSYWNPSAAAAKIAQKQTYIATVRPMVLAACQALVAKLSSRCPEPEP
jgi:hypothetical protein